MSVVITAVVGAMVSSTAVTLDSARRINHSTVRIVGEETSDLATTYGAMESFTLPRTGLKVGFPQARIIQPSGDIGLRIGLL